ncbi:MAG: hypothetical protein OFPI_40590 [Osedax symbiont Rs2]|nr:MAG: hypothetical protein OFPI_40590 [Osedax symbiont Rs2]
MWVIFHFYTILFENYPRIVSAIVLALISSMSLLIAKQCTKTHRNRGSGPGVDGYPYFRSHL